VTATSPRIRFACKVSFLKNGPKAGSLLDRSLLLSAGGLSGRVLTFHYHRHCTNVSFTAVRGMDVLQHCVSGQRSLVSHVSVKVLDALCVSAGKTEEEHPVLVSTNAVHNKRVQNVFRYQCDQHHLLVNGGPL